ncbi:MAG: tetratricopeptide repeat protein [Spirochaetales bacterium]|uniref:Tetratricopeptide repeat protein n=1 Tax=Candidatus Thalassospirochaeta sargassi TaxID=3119039 RepID=A0AAJ1IEG9_9SPIO|nr:tetratricopeptide repeat protein [Spirochaetales bacterium]
MKSIVKKTLLLAIFLSAASVLFAQSGNSLIDKGIAEFKSGKYSTSLTYFRDVVIDSNQREYHSDAYFWIAKSYIALRQLDNAEENLEFFILNYPDHPFYQEALYQKGRLMFLQNDYENCILESYNFLEKYPDSPYASNAYFWTAESLYALGRLEEAESLYTHIIYTFPSSYKVESANYRLSMIEQKYREESLVELLKLTHEEYLKSIEEFQVREKTYENALDSYQKKLSLIDGDGDNSQGSRTLSLELLDLQTEIRNKDNEIMALKRKIAELEYRLTTAESRAAEAAEAAKIIEVNPETAVVKTETEKIEDIIVEPEKSDSDILSSDDKIKLLELKTRAQEVKSFYLKYLSNVGN